MNRRARIVIADDQEPIRYLLTRLAKSEGDIVAEAADGAEAVAAVEQFAPDLLILDISMPGASGFEVARVLAERRPELRIIITSQHSDTAYADEAFRLGIQGYVIKGQAGTDLPVAIRTVIAGGRFRSSATPPVGST